MKMLTVLSKKIKMKYDFLFGVRYSAECGFCV